jgi:signal transduction histidine kinase
MAQGSTRTASGELAVTEHREDAREPVAQTGDGRSVVLPGGMGASGVKRWWAHLTSTPTRRRPTELIAALNDVAAAVSSTIALDEVLETIVERAKWLTNTEKAALVLVHEHTDTLDDETVVVRGRREQHSEEWWSAELADVASAVFREGATYLSLNRVNDAWLLCAPISVKDRPVGLLAAINSREHQFTVDQVDFLTILGAFAATAIENARLAEQTKYVLLSSERDRIAREMHDGISQSLFSVALGLEVCRKQVVRDPAAVASRLEELQQMVDVSRSELRRFIYDLRPVKLQELGLVGAIEYWIHEVTSSEGIEGGVRVEGEQITLTPSAEACLYRVAKESVSNVVKHSGASRFEVVLDYAPETVALRVSDNGCGFDRQSLPEPGEEGMSVGLRSMEERVAREQGRLDVATEDGKGTTIYVRLPR